jgi:tRNA G18 (ribose-2'-O)-methylase SpoU
VLIPITDRADERLEDYRDIRDRDLHGRKGLFIGEQTLVVEKMLRGPGLTRSVLALPRHAERLAQLAAPEVPVYAAEQEVIRAVAGFEIHRGVLAAGVRPPPEALTLDAAVPRRPGPLTVLICEETRNIDNMGLLFRNAAAFGVDAVVLSPSCHDPLYRKCLRVSIGHVLDIPWARSHDWAGDLQRLKREWGLALLGAATGPGSRNLDELGPPQRVGILVGSEYDGLSDVARNACDRLIRIPMAPSVDSLNVAVAAAVCLHRFSQSQRI